MSITLTKITPVQHEAALEWLESAFWAADFSDHTLMDVYRAIETWYSDGWDGFLADLGADTPTPEAALATFIAHVQPTSCRTCYGANRHEARCSEGQRLWVAADRATRNSR